LELDACDTSVAALAVATGTTPSAQAADTVRVGMTRFRTMTVTVGRVAKNAPRKSEDGARS
jgi:outer membrane protein assembly factor BamE (lipoprotein component of BamABCDE complex)